MVTRSVTGASAALARMIPFVLGRSRFIVLLAVAAVLLVALTLFLVSAALAVTTVWAMAREVWAGEAKTTAIKVEFLQVVTLMLKAVAFYLIGIGLYSLFIGPLPAFGAIKIDSLADLEAKIVSVIIVILAATFLEHFTTWTDAQGTLQFGIALAVVVVALVLFQYMLQREESHVGDRGSVASPASLAAPARLVSVDGSAEQERGA